MKVVFDMETGDPDDFFTLSLLAGHPAVELVAVTVTPGTPHQIGIARYVLERVGRAAPVGAFNIDHMKARGTKDERYVTCVSDWHYQTFGPIEPTRDAESAPDLLEASLGPEVTLVTGAPLRNIGALLKRGGARPLGPIVVQGGFAGEGVVPPAAQLPQFRGLRTCPSYNLNGDRSSAKAVIASERFASRRLVSKNVCHGVIYDRALHQRVCAVANPHPGLQLIKEGMERYLARDPAGKKLHDPLAACCAIDPSIATWAEVEIIRSGHEWGAELAPGSGVWIIVDCDRERFLDVFTRT